LGGFVDGGGDGAGGGDGGGGSGESCGDGGKMPGGDLGGGVIGHVWPVLEPGIHQTPVESVGDSIMIELAPPTIVTVGWLALEMQTPQSSASR